MKVYLHSSYSVFWVIMADSRSNSINFIDCMGNRPSSVCFEHFPGSINILFKSFLVFMGWNVMLEMAKVCNIREKTMLTSLELQRNQAAFGDEVKGSAT